jgi:hypothetical protein
MGASRSHNRVLLLKSYSEIRCINREKLEKNSLTFSQNTFIEQLTKMVDYMVD